MILQASFENVLRTFNFRPEITEAHQAKFTEIENWIQGEGQPGLIIYGPTGSGKTVLSEAIINLLRDNENELYDKWDKSKCPIRQELRHPVDAVRAMYIVKTAHLRGRFGLLYDSDGFAKSKVLFIDDVASPYEQKEIYFNGWDKSRKIFAKEGPIHPVAEVLEYRCNRGLPTVITTQLDLADLGEFYGGRIGERVTNRLQRACKCIHWEF